MAIYCNLSADNHSTTPRNWYSQLVAKFQNKGMLGCRFLVINTHMEAAFLMFSLALNDFVTEGMSVRFSQVKSRDKFGDFVQA